MKRLALITCVAFFASAQTPPLQRGEFRTTSLHSLTDGHVTHLSGQVTIESAAVVVRADQVDFNTDTNEIVARGHVRVKFNQRDEFRTASLHSLIDGHVAHLSGQVTIENATVVALAEQVDFHMDTNEMLAQGDVHVKVK